MKIDDTALPSIKIITPNRFGDNRGHFSETWNKALLTENGIDIDFIQDNQSVSVPSGTLRGLHFQAPPRAQDKLVRAITGSIFDIAVDIRRGSPTYGHWVGVELTAENGKQLLVPIGFAHGFVTRAPNTTIVYKCSDTYAPEAEGSVHFADRDLNIDWGIPMDAVTISDKDKMAPSFADLQSPFTYEG
jgi:dTDP-4-dehydrorhamnose 3,5-epimerase